MDRDRCFENLRCIVCFTQLAPIAHNSKINCKSCNTNYPIVEDIPIFINESISIFSNADFTKKRNLFFNISKTARLTNKIVRWLPSLGGNNLGSRNFKIISDLLLKKSINERPKVLIIGGSIIGEGMKGFVSSNLLDVVESDVSFGPRTRIIFDAHLIPYTSESFDCVVAQAVLEHVVNPEICIKEMHRILKPDGIIYAETPFMQQVHGGPYDFTRYTRSGHRKLFCDFSEIKSGATAGTGTALAWSLQYLLIALFGYTNLLQKTIKLLARSIFFWLKYIDYITRNNHRDEDGSSGFYFLGEKSDKKISDKSLIEYYR